MTIVISLLLFLQQGFDYQRNHQTSKIENRNYQMQPEPVADSFFPGVHIHLFAAGKSNGMPGKAKEEPFKAKPATGKDLAG
jgi:hypothetical protein